MTYCKLAFAYTALMLCFSVFMVDNADARGKGGGSSVIPASVVRRCSAQAHAHHLTGAAKGDFLTQCEKKG